MLRSKLLIHQFNVYYCPVLNDFIVSHHIKPVLSSYNELISFQDPHNVLQICLTKFEFSKQLFIDNDNISILGWAKNKNKK